MNRTSFASYLLQAAIALSLTGACTVAPSPTGTGPKLQGGATEPTLIPSPEAQTSPPGLVHSPAPPPPRVSSDTLLVLALDDSASMRSCSLQDWRYAIARVFLQLAEQYGEMSGDILITSFPKREVKIGPKPLSEITPDDLRAILVPSPYMEASFFPEVFNYMQPTSFQKAYSRRVLVLPADGDFAPPSSDPAQEAYIQKANRQAAKNELLKLDEHVEIYPVILCWKQLDDDDQNWWSSASKPQAGQAVRAKYQPITVDTDQDLAGAMTTLWQKVIVPLMPDMPSDPNASASTRFWGDAYWVTNAGYINLNTGEAGLFAPCVSEPRAQCLPFYFVPTANRFYAGVVSPSGTTLSPAVRKENGSVFPPSSSPLQWNDRVDPLENCRQHQWAFRPNLKQSQGGAVFWWRVSGVSLLGTPLPTLNTESVHYYGDLEIDNEQAPERVITGTVTMRSEDASFAPCYLARLAIGEARFNAPLSDRQAVSSTTEFMAVWPIGNQFADDFTHEPLLNRPASIEVGYAGQVENDYHLLPGPEITSLPKNLITTYYPGVVAPPNAQCNLNQPNSCQLSLKYYSKDPSLLYPYLVFEMDANQAPGKPPPIRGPACQPDQTLSYLLSPDLPSPTLQVTAVPEARVTGFHFYLEQTANLTGCRFTSFSLRWSRENYSDPNPEVPSLQSQDLLGVVRNWQCRLEIQTPGVISDCHPLLSPEDH